MRFIPPFYISLIMFVACIGFCNSSVFGDADTAWHLAAGDLIRQSHSIPLKDPWSFTAEGQTWYNLAWLFDIGLSALFAWGGFCVVYALTIAVFAGSVATMAHLCFKRGASRLVVYFVSLFMLGIIHEFVLARPVMCSVAFIVAFYAILHGYRATGRLSGMLVLPLLVLLWANMHGGFLLAFVVMGLFAAEAIWQGNRKAAREYGFVIMLCLCATLINPYGFSLYYGAYETVSGVFSKHYINEWQPVPIGSNIPMTVLLLLVLITSGGTRKNVPLVDRMLTIVMTLLALSSLRHAVFAALLLMPTLSLRLTALLDASPAAGYIQKKSTAMFGFTQKIPIRIMGATIAISVFVSICTPGPYDDIVAQSPKRFAKTEFPVAEAAYIAEHYPGLRFMNHYNLGGYLDYLWRGKIKVFVDGRADSLYSEEMLADYKYFIESYGYGGRAQMIAAFYHLDGLIIPNVEKSLAMWEWNPYWKSVYHGPAATVFIRRDLAGMPPATKPIH